MKLTNEAELRIYAPVNYTIIGSDNGLSPVRWQPIIRARDGLLSIGPCGIYFNGILLEIQKFSFRKMYINMSSSKMAVILSLTQCVKSLPDK